MLNGIKLRVEEEEMFVGKRSTSDSVENPARGFRDTL